MPLFCENFIKLREKRHARENLNNATRAMSKRAAEKVGCYLSLKTGAKRKFRLTSRSDPARRFRASGPIARQRVPGERGDDQISIRRWSRDNERTK